MSTIRDDTFYFWLDESLEVRWEKVGKAFDRSWTGPFLTRKSAETRADKLVRFIMKAIESRYDIRLPR